MSKLKIEHGASKVNWVLLKTNIEESISNEIELMCQWSENDRKYIVNQLLRFGLTQSEEFQKYKADRESNPSKRSSDTKPVASAMKPTPELASKASSLMASAASRQQSTES
jgi:hypothetical protein